MIAFLGYQGRPPRTLTADEQSRLLAATSLSPEHLRDHVIISMALGTGLREHEILALDFGDVFDHEGRCRQRIVLRVFKGGGKAAAVQDVVLAERLRAKLEEFHRWKRARFQGLQSDAPLFLSQWGFRLSARQVRHLFRVWQGRAGFERRLPFHALRHTSVSNVYRLGRDLRLTQRFARHASILTTSIYMHPSDDEMIGAVEAIAC